MVKKTKSKAKKGVAAKIGAEIDKAIEKGCGEEKKQIHHHKHSDGCGAFYGLGIIGAAVYFIQAATGFWAGVLGILKALVWPAFVVYKLLGLPGL